MNTEKIKVFSTQFNYKYGDQIHFPYSIACLVAWAQEKEDLKDKLHFEKTFVLRAKFDEYVERCTDVDILLCSCYVWNWEMTNALAKKVREKNPDCLIVFGGPHVPKWYSHYEKESFFVAHDYVDILAYGEGEQIMENIFRAYINTTGYEEILGIETKDFKTAPQEKIRDLTHLPSPYLNNTVWNLVEKEPGLKFIAAWESNRGCPFSCTFCDWGSSTMSKVRKREAERLLEEIEWFGQNNIPYIDVCDANFGLYKDLDLELAKKFTATKMKYGYPEKIRPAWAKVSSSKLIPIAKVLLEGGMLRAVTLAVQSLDKHTLETVKRRNIRFDKWSELVHTFRKEKIENYTELILGLPGETLESYKSNLEQIAELFPRPVVYIYNCGVFPNAPMNVPAYREEHAIEAIKSPVYLMHSTVHEKKIPEYENIVIKTKTMTTKDLREASLYSWMLMAFHSFGVLEYVARYFNKEYDMKYMDFYGNLEAYCKETDGSLFSNEYNYMIEYVKRGYSGSGWEHYDDNLGDICWPPEEATLLRCIQDSTILQKEVLLFIEWLCKTNKFYVPSAIGEDLSNFQAFVMTTRDSLVETKSSIFKYTWKKYFEDMGNLENREVNYQYPNKIRTEDHKTWCYETAWFGRGPKKYKTDPVDISEVQQ